MKLVLAIAAAIMMLGQMALAENFLIKSAILKVETEQPLPVSRLDLAPDDLGFAGAGLAIEDNSTTGGFLGQDYALETVTTDPAGAVAALEALLADGTQFVGVIGEAQSVLDVADAAGARALVFNVSAADDALRNEACRGNLLHIGPSFAMRADALSQYMVWKKWTDLALITGSHEADQKWGAALRNSITKFGLKLRNEMEFEDTGGARRTDTGHVQVQKQMPVFTQGIKRADVVYVADESEVFGAYVPYHTWNATPVAGSAGLVPSSWHPALEAWGATQFQRRFERSKGRRMWPEDYQAWLALRVLGEAVTRTSSADPQAIQSYILSDNFEIAGFKGEKLTFRPWNGQLRQPILLTNDRLIVSVSPQEGFLHQTSLLDTLGSDMAQSTCAAFN